MRINSTAVFVIVMIVVDCITLTHAIAKPTRNDLVIEEQIKTKTKENATLFFEQVETESIRSDVEFELWINMLNYNVSLKNGSYSNIICGKYVRRYKQRNMRKGRIGLSKDGKLLPVIYAPMMHESSMYCRQGIEYTDIYSVIMLDLSHTSYKTMPQFSHRLYNTLRYVDLSYNYIRRLSTDTFSQFKQLKFLDLSSNRLQEFVIDSHFLFNHFMTTNGLFYLNVSDQNFTIDCPTHVPQITHATDSLFYIDSSGNYKMSELTASCRETTKYFNNLLIHVDGERLDCNCTIQFDWESGILPDSKNCECYRHISNKTSVSPEIITHEYVVIVCTVSFISGFAIFGIVVCCWCYLKRRSGCYSYCMKILPSNGDEEIQHTYRTGVYIVSTEEDAVVLEHIMMELERRGIPTISERRDLAHEAGKNVISLIHRCIDTTKRTLFLISAKFIEDEECMYTFYQAKGMELSQRRFVIIIIQLESQQIPMNFSDMYVQNIVFNYPFPPNEENEFWKKLVECIIDENVHVHITQNA